MSFFFLSSKTILLSRTLTDIITDERKGEDQLPAAGVGPGAGQQGEEDAGDVHDEALVHLQRGHASLKEQ